jgi:muramoyltetrapeptide carboxypeptidase
LRPTFLKSGDRVAVIATAKKVLPGQLDGAMKMIASWGLELSLGRSLYAASGPFAGTDAERLADLQWALDDPSIKAVLFARGGYGTSRIIDSVDWTAFKSHPKWLVGFSDLTFLHGAVYRMLDVETLHAAMPIFFADGSANQGSESLKRALFGTHHRIRWAGHNLNRKGVASGKLIGGNLAVLVSALGTQSECDWAGKILFIEDLTEYLYRHDRLMVQLKRAGKLDGLAGVVVGQFTEMLDNDVPFGKDAYGIIKEALSEFDYPVAFDAPIGHVLNNEAVFHGRSAELMVGEDSNLVFSNND